MSDKLENLQLMGELSWGRRGAAETKPPMIEPEDVVSTAWGVGEAGAVEIADLVATCVGFLTTVAPRQRQRQLPFALSNVEGAPVVDVEFQAAASHVAMPEMPTTRARYFRVPGKTPSEIWESLRARDERNAGAKRKSAGGPLVRDANLLGPAMVKRSAIEDAGGKPSFDIAWMQNTVPFGFGARPAVPERDLRPVVETAIERASRLPYAPPGYRARRREAAHLGDFTTHDPVTLSPRFLEYVKPRVEIAPPRTDVALRLASDIMIKVWQAAGIAPRARSVFDVDPEYLADIIKDGNAGEYRTAGISSRRDPRMMHMLSDHITGFVHAGRELMAGRTVPSYLGTLQHQTLSFGKEEAKAAKPVPAHPGDDGAYLRPDGTWATRVAPIPRFIFSPSPCNYAVAAFLHHDVSKSMMDLDPTHGPGFGPGRGRSHKFTDLVTRSFGDKNVMVDDEMVMSDIEKWDASATEALLGCGMDTMERAVGKEHLTDLDRSTRLAMYKYAKRTLLTKIVEHPSGYNLVLHGTMPSGSYYTSLVNTVCNDLLAIGLLVRTMLDAGHTVDVDECAATVSRWLLSYGDNQLFSTAMFREMGVSYDKEKHAAFLATLGMKLKLDETEITQQLGRVRFCSRAVVRTPHGLAVTRSHDPLISKLAGRPTASPLADKLYVRALMMDYLGTDPIAYQMLEFVDRQIVLRPGDADTIPKQLKREVEETAMHVFGSADATAIGAVVAMVTATDVPRADLLLLHLPRVPGAAFGDVFGMGVRGGRVFRGAGTEMTRWLAEQTPDQWFEFLTRSGQLGVLEP
uniref:RNA-dependent RNA polymerase n=1 Tax=Sclerotinia sclerotiorum tetramycovirus-1 TaxID=2231775 RepID=A0A2Z4QK98_9VIRU|nr:RNA-dependent RNA polymerase [Sclerotinia sclerotiorum tetramycovirus-1]